MFVENLMLRKNILDVLENRCWSVGVRLYRENRKTILTILHVCTNLEVFNTSNLE